MKQLKPINYKSKINFQLSLREVIDLANIIAECHLYQIDFMKLRDRKIRKMFRESYEQRHKLWSKISSLSEKEINRQ